MKRIFLGIVAAFIFVATASSQMRWGATAGVDIANLKWSQQFLRTTEFTSDQSVGYFAGVIGEYSIPGIGFGIDFGLQYVQRGSTMNLGDFKVWSSDGYKNEERVYLHCLDIPLHVRFKYANLNGIERKIAPLLFVGPSIAIHIADNGVEAFDYKPVSFGLEVGGGVELFRKYQLTCGYTWDLTGSAKAVKLDNFNSKSRTWKIALSYYF